MSTSDTTEVELSSLTDEEREIFTNEKIKMFKMTIAACALYGSIAIFSIFVFFFTSWGSKIYNDMFPFFITYILGTIFIIFYLANEIYNYKPKKSDFKLGYDAEMCPDYWNLEYVKEQDHMDDENNSFVSKKQNINKNHFRYKCTMNKDLFSANEIKEKDSTRNFNIGDKNTLYVNAADQESIGIKNDEIFTEFKKHAANMNGYTYEGDELVKNSKLSVSDGDKEFSVTDIPMACDNVYPLYLSIMDTENAKNNTSEPSNRFRCAYAKSCGVSWSEAGCT